MAKVSVVIPNYNGEKYLEDCLTALKEQSMNDFELIIVDNGSKDKSTGIVRECFPEAKLIRLDKNFGFSRAVNDGIRAAEAPYIILLNNDTRVEKDFIRELYDTICGDDRIFSVSARMLQMNDPALIDSAGDMYCCLGWAYARGKDKPSAMYDKRADIFSACAGAAIYRKSVFNVIGYFDEMHFAYLEDVDIGYRARINGYRNVYEPRAVVYHAGSGMSGSRYNAFKISLSSQNNVYVPYKNMPLLQLVINIPFLLAGFIVKTVFFIRKGEGGTYLRGLMKGISMCARGHKYPYSNRNLGNYVKIQLELWRNAVLRFLP
ncbi:MAG: glycosyltransferase family 2 protein [Lachnospiraceae bacterium]|nr:glycosyltransferase family 2 protein [Lachnospiraceae bacterium]